mmetsp:Transcript_33818/g.49716  ORF Transcript_33818/g.49716 Transcript_33818/m.49716 type:complete len:83 (+) Transcript_33818:26-274(+)
MISTFHLPSWTKSSSSIRSETCTREMYSKCKRNFGSDLPKDILWFTYSKNPTTNKELKSNKSIPETDKRWSIYPNRKSCTVN